MYPRNSTIYLVLSIFIITFGYVHISLVIKLVLSSNMYNNNE